MSDVIARTPPGLLRIDHTHLFSGSAAPAWYTCGTCQGNLHSFWQCGLIVTTAHESKAHTFAVPGVVLCSFLHRRGPKISQNLTW